MNGLPYYKAYPRDFIEGTIGMPFELKAAYRLVLDMIYMQGGKLPDDDRYISGLLGCSVRAWKKHREALISMGKIYTENGIISNFRADKELESSRKLQEKNAENGAKTNKNNNLAKSNAKLTRGIDTEPDTETKDKAKASSSGEGFEWKDFDRSNTDHLNRLEKALLEAGGESLNQATGGFLMMTEPLRWLEAGANVEIHILPTIRAICARNKSVKSWNYFTNAILEAAAKPALKVTGSLAEQAAVDPEIRDFVEKFGGLQ